MQGWCFNDVKQCGLYMFVFHVAIQKLKDYIIEKYNYARRSVWV
jgi:hypothetical protein